MNPKITVLIPTFNRGQYIAECLDSLFAQTLPAVQTIVVNDGSTDHTLAALAPYRGRIEYFETPQLGKPSAINRGMKEVRGDYLWIFDDDDVALPDALQRFVAPLEAHPEHGFSYGTFFYTGSQPGTHRIGPVLYELNIPDLKRKGFLAPLLENNFLGGAALFARMSCYAEVGLFDPALVRSQDYEMAIRFARRFTGIRIEGGPTFHYRQHEGVRGSLQDRFTSDRALEKWLQYDAVFFRKLYRELPLEAYLAPGAPAARLRRQALLQRMTVMASKLSMPEVAEDLNALARLKDSSAFSADERSITDFLVRCWFNRMSLLTDRDAFPRAVQILSASSRTVALLRKEMAKAIIRFGARSPGRIRESLSRLIRLYR